MEIMSREPLADSQLVKIMQKFRPIAPKPPPAASALPSGAPEPTGAGPPKRRRRGRERKPKKTTTAAAAPEKETGAVISPPPMARVTVETVTAAGFGSGSGSIGGDEIRRRLEADASPCFASDSADRVTWINAAFRRMVLCEESSALVRVELATRGMVPGGACGFTCVARVRRGRAEMVVPCDAWRVGEGKWAWRLDVATALGLGLRCE